MARGRNAMHMRTHAQADPLSPRDQSWYLERWIFRGVELVIDLGFWPLLLLLWAVELGPH